MDLFGNPSVRVLPFTASSQRFQFQANPLRPRFQLSICFVEGWSRSVRWNAWKKRRIFYSPSPPLEYQSRNWKLNTGIPFLCWFYFWIYLINNDDLCFDCLFLQKFKTELFKIRICTLVQYCRMKCTWWFLSVNTYQKKIILIIS